MNDPLLKAKSSNLNAAPGQVMILATLALGGTLLGATTIAGLLMIYQIRQTTDLTNSARAIFAADAGLECGLYNFFKNPGTPCPSTFTLPNGASYSEAADDPVTPKNILSKGTSATARRAFLILLESATTTFP